MFRVVRSLWTSFSNGSHHMHRFIDRMFSNFFPAYSTTFNSDDCRWFFTYANSQTQWLQTPINKVTVAVNDEVIGHHKSCVDHSCTEILSIYNLKLYFCRILGKRCGNPGPNDPLAFYNTEVSGLYHVQKHLIILCVYNALLYQIQPRLLVGEVLMAAPEHGPPTYYIPLFYQHSTFIPLEQDAIVSLLQFLHSQQLLH